MRKLLFLALLVALFGCGKSNSHTYTVGVDPSWYPLELLGQESNVLAFSIELLVEIAKKEKLALAIMPSNYDDLRDQLDKSQVSAILSSMRPYTFFEKIYTFGPLYLQTGPVIVVPLNSKIKSESDLKMKEVGVVQGSSATLILQKVPGLILHSFGSLPQTIQAVRVQEVQAGALPILVAQRFVTDIYSDALKIVTPPLDEEGLRLITLHNKEEKLQERFEKGLAALKKSKDYDRLLAKWGLAPGSPRPNPKTVQAFINRHLQ